MYKSYDFASLERETQKHYEESNPFYIDTINKHSLAEKYYCLSMFPYPSGSELHMGHMRNYTIGDCISRLKRVKGYSVLQPMGWDAFGLPAHNAAIKNNMSPDKWTFMNIENMRQSLKSMGFAYDWSKEIYTCKPEYYGPQQFFFLQLLERGIAYRKSSWVYWDPVDKTVLANEQVIDGKGWRSNAPVEKRNIAQWFIRASYYASELYHDLDDIDQWPENLVKMQRQWIGKSDGVHIDYDLFESIPGCDIKGIKVFTTRLESLMGVQALALAPGHPVSLELAKRSDEVKEFINRATVLSEKEEHTSSLDWDTQLQVVHPVSKIRLPLWISNRVRDEYATEAMHISPAYDTIDAEFVQRHGIEPQEHNGEIPTFETATHYRLRDWGISRQRSWGCPIPVVHCNKCGIVPELPERLPILTDSPIDTTCPKCNSTALRESDTFDTFIESSWYYARYICPDSKDFLTDNVHDFLPVDCYIGGIEHANLHFLYARLFYRLMRDVGYLDMSRLKGKEPFVKVITQGMVLMNGTKMSKSKGNTISPHKMTSTYGVDAVRMFILVAAPAAKDFEFKQSGITGIHRFLTRVYAYGSSIQEEISSQSLESCLLEDNQNEVSALIKLFNAGISDMEENKFNTAVSYAIKIFNTLQNMIDKKSARVAFRDLLKFMQPMAPHITHYLWRELIGGEILDCSYPAYIKEQSEFQSIVIQINGKFVGILKGNNLSKEIAVQHLKTLGAYKNLTSPNITRVIWIAEKVCNFILHEETN
jgi:leucyl-tRNA synthetase